MCLTNIYECNTAGVSILGHTTRKLYRFVDFKIHEKYIKSYFRNPSHARSVTSASEYIRGDVTESYMYLKI